MPRSTGCHWLAPTAMLGALAGGSIFAVTHHLFYYFLDGKNADQSYSISNVSSQEISIALGTALAFLVKACLVFAVSVAFVQVFWRTINAITAVSPTLGCASSAYSASSNPFVLFNMRTWRHYPVLLFLASIAWLIPIASIVTPATLSIKSAPVHPPPTSIQQVPSIDFRSLAFNAPLSLRNLDYLQSLGTGEQPPYNYIYAGPSRAVESTVGAVMSSGEILAIKPPGLNTTWHLDFYGPSLKCENIKEEMRKALVNNIHSVFNLGGVFEYLAWFPNTTMRGNRTDQPTSLPFPTVGGLILPDLYLNPGLLIQYDAPPKQMEFYIAAMPSVFEQYWASIDHQIPSDSIFLRCELLNSSYSTKFRYTDGAQSISVDARPVDDSLKMQTVPEVAGYLWRNGGYQPCLAQHSGCYLNPNVLQRLAYQSLLQAFASYLTGSVSMTFTSFETTTHIDTRALDTVLDNTIEFDAMEKGLSSVSLQVKDNSTLQDFLLDLNGTRFRGISTKDFAEREMQIPLSLAIEELFKNVTTSLMASSALQSNNTSSTAPGVVQVTSTPYHNIYTYSAWKLGLAYGIACLAASIAVGIGLACILKSGLSYSNNLSTVFIAAKGAELSVQIEDQHSMGNDPLKDYLAKAKVKMPGRMSKTTRTTSGRGNYAFSSRVASYRAVGAEVDS